MHAWLSGRWSALADAEHTGGAIFVTWATMVLGPLLPIVAWPLVKGQVNTKRGEGA